MVSNCKVYGGGVAKIAATAGIPYAEAEAFAAEYDRRLPFVRDALRWAADVAQRRGYVRSLSGRRHRFPLWEPAGFELSHQAREEGWAPRPSAEAMKRELRGRGLPARIQRYRAYKALNDVLQGGGTGDLPKEVMARQWEAGVCDVLGPPLVQVHDEEGWSRPRTKAGREAAAEALDLFRQVGEAWNLRVPILVERRVGPSWGKTEKEKPLRGKGLAA